MGFQTECWIHRVYIAQLVSVDDLSEAELLIASDTGPLNRLYTTWNSDPASPRRWLRRFVHYYNATATSSLSSRPPAEKS